MVYSKESEMDRAKLFWSGRSQAVRLPKEFRFEGDEVRISRRGDAVILEPIATDWEWLDALSGPFDQDFIDAIAEKPDQQERPEIDEFFK
jgi:antitoxin VapB